MTASVCCTTSATVSAIKFVYMMCVNSCFKTLDVDRPIHSKMYEQMVLMMNGSAVFVSYMNSMNTLRIWNGELTILRTVCKYAWT